MAAEKPTGSLSLDLDNLWSYLKTHGESSWELYPTYLDTFLPIVLDLLDAHGLKITFFLVGRDVTDEKNRPYLQEIVKRGHEVGNHSYNHEPWMQDYDAQRVDDELGRTHRAIEEILGVAPVGFRGPGFCYSPTILRGLTKYGYTFDASTLPSILGPIARLYYFASSTMNRAERKTRKGLFGKFSDGFQSLKPFLWETSGGQVLEIPVTTVPVFRTPFHLSYLLWLSRYSRLAAKAYLEIALRLCRLFKVGPSFLLHPLDLLGKEDAPQLYFFPGMDLSRKYKIEFTAYVLNRLGHFFDVVPMSVHARRASMQRAGAFAALRRRPAE